ncbi:MAG: glycosyltransferase, partial [Planctomycetota bacterium]|nr:glycosyltransferase [Planctomycetota bacterium]
MSHSSPRVSVIVPTYNRAHLVGETLESIQKQTLSDWECLIVDDGSTDNTQAVAESFASSDGK